MSEMRRWRYSESLVTCSGILLGLGVHRPEKGNFTKIALNNNLKFYLFVLFGTFQ